MQHFSADSLILRSTVRGEHDRSICVLCAERGRFYAIVKGAGAMHRREVAATEPYTWSNIEYYEKNDIKWVKNAASKESFAGIRYDMDKLFLAAYIAEVAYELSDEREPAGEILPLTLNTLHMLSRTDGENARIKAAFELRAACVAGFSPDLSRCAVCQKPADGEVYLDVAGGTLICRACHQRAQQTLPREAVDDAGERTALFPLDASALAAFDYVERADPKRVFAFRLEDKNSLAAFCAAAEGYLLYHLERGFPTLENYKKLAALAPKPTE